MESISFFTWLILFNSCITLVLIFNQNETVKDGTTNPTSSSSNPLENFTWIALTFQLVLFLVQAKFHF